MANSARIFVVESDRQTQELLFLLLRQRGYSPLTLDDGQQALDLLDRGIEPKLVILDLMLPSVPSDAVLERLQSDPRLRRVPVIAVTECAVRHMHLPAVDAVLYKPLDYAAVMRTVDRLAGA